MRRLSRFALRKLLLVCVLVGCCFAADYKKCKLLDIHYQLNRMPMSINGDKYFLEQDMYVITVQIDGLAITGKYQSLEQGSELSELAVGEDIEAKVKGNQLVLRSPKGKKLKAAIVKSEPAQLVENAK